VGNGFEMKNTQPDNLTKPFKPDTNWLTLNRLEALITMSIIQIHVNFVGFGTLPFLLVFVQKTGSLQG
jgi:hypothetical protein